MLTSPARVLRPRTLDEALTLRAAHPDAQPLAGGTDVMVFLEMGAIDPPAFLNLWGLDEIRGIEAADGGLWIGALTTHIDLARDKRVLRSAPILAESARTVGAVQIQNRGTLGGNIANASPAGDTLPVLLALDAQVEVASAARGRRRIPMEKLYTGYRTLSTQPDELITRVFVPAISSNDRVHFRKVGTRLAQAISKVILGGRLRIEWGLVSQARLAFGSVAAVPLRVHGAEAAMVGLPVREGIPRALKALETDIKPIDDVRSTAEYRRKVAAGVLRAWLETMA